MDMEREVKPPRRRGPKPNRTASFLAASLCIVILIVAVACTQPVATDTPGPTSTFTPMSAPTLRPTLTGAPTSLQRPSATPSATPTTSAPATRVPAARPTPTPTQTPRDIDTVPVPSAPSSVPSFHAAGIGDVTWACNNGACSGYLNARDLSQGRWSCSRTGPGGWECASNLDRSDGFTERWWCEQVAGGWTCWGDVDKHDLYPERWRCSPDGAGALDCEGDIDRANAYMERWSCTLAGPSGRYCQGSLGHSYPLMIAMLLSE